MRALADFPVCVIALRSIDARARGGQENMSRPHGRAARVVKRGAPLAPLDDGSAALVDGLHRPVAARAVHGGLDRQHVAIRRERPDGLPRHRLLALVGLLRARVRDDQLVTLERGAGDAAAVVALLHLIGAVGHDRVSRRVRARTHREGPGDLQRIALLSDDQRDLWRLTLDRRLLGRRLLAVGRSLRVPPVRRELALRAIEHPVAAELGLRLGDGHADPEQEQGHHADRVLQTFHSGTLLASYLPVRRCAVPLCLRRDADEQAVLRPARVPEQVRPGPPRGLVMAAPAIKSITTSLMRQLPGRPRPSARSRSPARASIYCSRCLYAWSPGILWRATRRATRTGGAWPMDEWTGGRAVVELLKAEGVRHIFGIVGSTFLDVLDRLYDDSSVEYINVRHEQAAAFMADGLARVTDRPGVCLVTSGPGATNLLTGVAAAHVAHSPVVVLVGGIALDHYQKDAFQEFDLVSMFRPVTKQATLVNRAERIPELVRGALRTAMSGRPGPVFVEIPRDLLSAKLPAPTALTPEAYRVIHAQPPHAEAVREAARRLGQAERPLLLVGGGASRAGADELVVQLSDRYRIPMITAYGRNDAVPNAHPLYLGPLGRAGAPEAATACRRADVIVAVGSRLAQFTSQFDDRYIRPRSEEHTSELQS